MDIRRITFLILSVIIFLSVISVPIFHDKLGIEFIVMIYLVFLLIEILVGLLLMTANRINVPTDKFTIFLGILSLRFKRIYYSDLGYFYAWKNSDDNILIYKQNFLSMHKIISVPFDDNIHSLNLDIKKELDSIYSKEIKEKTRKDKIKNSYKSWDGFIDTKSKRDDKIKNILGE